MTEVLHLGALLPATVGACCTLGASRSGRAARVAAAAASLLMLLAMIDVSARVVGAPAPAWAALLVFAALLTAPFAQRRRTESRTSGLIGAADPTEVRDSARGGPHSRAMAAHGGLGLVVMAALLLVMGGGAAGVDALGVAPVAASGHHGAASSAALVAFVGVGAFAYVLFSGLLAVAVLRSPARRGPRALAAVETASMGASTLLMLAALL